MIAGMYRNPSLFPVASESARHLLLSALSKILEGRIKEHKVAGLSSNFRGEYYGRF